MRLKNLIDIMPDFGLLEYPIYDEAHRDVLNQKITDHFWNREIGQETPDMFRLALRRKMNEIMPYYNQQYAASAITIDPLKTMGITGSSTGHGTNTTNGTTSQTASSDAKSRAVASETPQTRLAGNEDYATSAQDNVSHTGTTGENTENSSHVQDTTGSTTTGGFTGQQSQLIYQHRQTLVNIDMMIIDELEYLFMQVWSSGDEFTPTSGLGIYWL
jgi:hypothetical protein